MSKVNKILSRPKESPEDGQQETSSSQSGSSQPHPKMAILKRSADVAPTPSVLSTQRDTNKETTDKAPFILQRTGTPSDDIESSNRVTTTKSASGIAGLSLYDILKGYEFPFPNAVPLISNDLTFKKSNTFLKLLKATTDFLVVTIIGPPGAGKSTILNYLAGKSKNVEFNSSDSKLFLPRKETDDEKTTNFYISPESIVLIEMASIFNGSAAIDLIPLMEKFSTLETTTTSWNLRVVRWALAVSHLVLVLGSTVIDPKIFQLINSASTLHPMQSVFSENSHPEIVFVGNKCRLSEAAEEQLSTIFNTADLLGFGRRARIKPNTFVLPHSKFRDINGGNEKYEDFRRKIYEYNQWTRSSFSEEEIDGQAKIPQTVTIADWFNFGSNLWDEMGQSSYFSEYVKLLQY